MEKSRSIGRAKTIIVEGNGPNAVAVVSTVIARQAECSREHRLAFPGPVQFAESTQMHITNVILPISDRIMDAFSLPHLSFDLSAVNLAATGVSDISVKVSGFSADLSVFVALLSAALEMALSEDIAFTGHIASMDGDIRAVKAIPAKLRAAVADPSVRRFILPKIDSDTSLLELSPGEKVSIADAIVAAKAEIEVVEVADITDLVASVFPPETLVLASLQKGFYDAELSWDARANPVGRATQFMVTGNEQHFWNSLSHALLENRHSDSSALLGAMMRFHTSKETYDKHFGRRLMQVIRSLPPTTHRLKTVFPLCQLSDCLGLSRLATEQDFEDVQLLFSAVVGDRCLGSPSLESPDKPTGTSNHVSNDSALDAVLSEIMPTALAARIGQPIDTARASYAMESVVIDSSENFCGTVTAFFIHLARHYRGVSGVIEQETARREAFDLLERAFSQVGGFAAARAEARDATHGGMRAVLDAMTEEFKKSEQHKHVNLVLQQALDPLDWPGKVRLAKALLDRLAPHLPAEIAAMPPERFAQRMDIIVPVYVDSLAKVNHLLRRL